MTWTTRYLGIISYAAISALIIAKDIVATTEHAIALLAPIAAYIALDQYKHRQDE
jgi:hypothetical protein